MTETRTGTSTALPEQEILERARDLAARLAGAGLQRDGAGVHAEAGCETLHGYFRDSGLLALSIPTAFGGTGASWPTLYRVIRILAEADLFSAQAFAHHHLQLAAIQLRGSALQQRRLLTATAAQQWLWGEGANPGGRQVVASIHPNGFILDGQLASGSIGADWLMVTAWDPGTQTAVTGAVASSEGGVDFQPGSNAVHLSSVLLTHEQVLQRPGQAITVQATLRALVAQLIRANLHLGAGLSGFDSALGQARIGSAADDGSLQLRFGELKLLLHPVEVLADHAAVKLERAFRRGVLVNARERGELAIAVDEAECLAQRAVSEVNRQVRELNGKHPGTARVELANDAIDSKLRDLGRHALDGSLPEPVY